MHFDHTRKKGNMHLKTNPLHIKIKQIKYTRILTTSGKRKDAFKDKSPSHKNQIKNKIYMHLTTLGKKRKMRLKINQSKIQTQEQKKKKKHKRKSEGKKLTLPHHRRGWHDYWNSHR